MNIYKKCIFVAALCFSSLHAIWNPPPEIGIWMYPTKFVYVAAPFFRIDLAYNAYGQDKQVMPLTTLVMGQPVVLIKDIFLASKLAGQGKLQLTDDSQFLSLLSTMSVNLEQEQKRVRFGIETSLTMALGSSDVLFTAGATIPFEYYEQSNDATYSGAWIGNTDAQVTAFFKQKFSNIQSFVNEEILQPKGLALDTHQQSLGLADIRLYAAFDVSNYWQDAVERMQGGAVMHMQAPGVLNPNIVWPIERGLGATYIGGFGQLYLSFNEIIKPFLVFEVLGAVPQDLLMRVPMVKTVTNAQIAAGTNTLDQAGILCAPTSENTLGGVVRVIVPFAEYDETVPYFADTNLLVRRVRGAWQQVKFGNKFDLGGIGELAIWYEHDHRMGDKITRSKHANPETEDKVYNFKVVEKNTRNSFNVLGWDIKYFFSNGVTLKLGTQHVIKGKAAPQYHTGFFLFEFGF